MINIFELGLGGGLTGKGHLLYRRKDLSLNPRPHVKKKKKKKNNTATHCINPDAGKQRQGDCHLFEVIFICVDKPVPNSETPLHSLLSLENE